MIYPLLYGSRLLSLSLPMMRYWHRYLLWKNARLAADATYAKDRADGLAKLEAVGLTPAQAEAVARKKP